MSVIQGIRAAGNGLEANQKKDIWVSLAMLERYNTPAMQYLFFGKKKQKPVHNKKGKFIWFEDTVYPDQTTVTANITASGGKLTLNAANVDSLDCFSSGSLILIEQTDEMAIVDSYSTTSVVLANPDGSALSNVTSGTIRVVTTMFAEGSGAPDAYSTQEEEVSNYLTIMKRTVSTTGRDQAGDTHTDGISHTEQLHKTMREMKYEFERLAMLSLTSGNASSAGALVKTWGRGLYGTLKTNVTNIAAGALTEANFDDFIKSVGAKGTPNKIAYAGTDRYFEIQSIIKAKYGTLPTNLVVKKYGVDVTTYKYGHLNIDLIHNPVMDAKFSDAVFAIDKANFVGRFMANDNKGSRNFRIEKGVEASGTDGTTDLILADLGAQYMNESTGGIIIPS